jgi:hypothetical protein
MTKRRPARGRSHIGKVPSVRLSTTFEAGPGFVTAVIHIDENSTIGLKFETPEQLLGFFTELMENAVIAWPDNEFIQYYLSDDEQKQN